MNLSQDFQILFHFLCFNLNANTLKTLIVALTFLITALSGDTWKVLKDNTKKYTIEHPVDWKVSNVGDIEYILMPPIDSSDKFAENINIVIMPNPDSTDDMGPSIAAIKKQYKAMIKGYEYYSSGDYPVGNLKMFHINYKTVYDTIDMNINQYFYLTKANIYIITSTSPIKGDPRFPALSEKVVKTFKLL